LACCEEIGRDVEAHVERGINKRMHEHFAVDRCSVLVVAKSPP